MNFQLSNQISTLEFTTFLLHAVRQADKCNKISPTPQYYYRIAPHPLRETPQPPQGGAKRYFLSTFLTPL